MAPSKRSRGHEKRFLEIVSIDHWKYSRDEMESHLATTPFLQTVLHRCWLKGSANNAASCKISGLKEHIRSVL